MATFLNFSLSFPLLNLQLISENFLKLNREILERYSSCSTAAEVIAEQNEYMSILEQESSAKRSQDMTDIDLSVDICNPNRQTIPEFSDSSEDAESSSEEEDSEESDSEPSSSSEDSPTVEHSSEQVDQISDKISSVTFLDQDEVYDL